MKIKLKNTSKIHSGNHLKTVYKILASDSTLFSFHS